MQRYIQSSQGTVELNARRLVGMSAFYDTYKYTGTAAGASLGSSIQFFNVPRGQSGSGFSSAKTLVETNMSEANRFPEGVDATIRKIMVSIYETGSARGSEALAEKIAALFTDSVAELRVSKSLEFQSRLKDIGYGITGIPAGNGGQPQVVVNPAPSFRGSLELAEPIGIKALQTFDFKIFHNGNEANLNTLSLGEDLKIRVYLLGNFTRRMR